LVNPFLFRGFVPYVIRLFPVSMSYDMKLF
jgi:hypothetical protein